MLFTIHEKHYSFLSAFYLTTSSSSYTQGAPENVLERCRWIRVGGGARIPMTSDLREHLLGTVREWSSGRDTLRCLAMATRDSPPDPRTLNLENSSAFSEYEVIEAKQYVDTFVILLKPENLFCGKLSTIPATIHRLASFDTWYLWFESFTFTNLFDWILYLSLISCS